MKYILDASVALRWVLPHGLTPKAIQLRDEYVQQLHELLSPNVFIDEVASTKRCAVNFLERMQRDTSLKRKRRGSHSFACASGLCRTPKLTGDPSSTVWC